MGKLIEIVFGKASCLEPNEDVHDLQEFHQPISNQMEYMEKILLRHGFCRNGKELFCDGRTGEVIEAPLLCGKVSYTKLHHLVSKKMHARAKGPVDILTRQPTEGRSNHGGLRFGPMEIECTVAHAAAEILRERTLTAADDFHMFICRRCGLTADGNERIAYYFCRFCGTSDEVVKVNIPYTSKLMVQELNALGIKVIFKVKEKNEL